ncbi:MAG: hypothetical protein KTV16_11505 [Acidimicrobiia bacterium]|nr:hypothetical protein [Acidimicrobiia bacterium]
MSTGPPWPGSITTRAPLTLREFSSEVLCSDQVDAVAGATRLRFEADHDSATDAAMFLGEGAETL